MIICKEHKTCTTNEVQRNHSKWLSLGLNCTLQITVLWPLAHCTKQPPFMPSATVLSSPGRH